MQNSTKIELFTKIAQRISVPVLKKIRHYYRLQLNYYLPVWGRVAPLFGWLTGLARWLAGTVLPEVVRVRPDALLSTKPMTAVAARALWRKLGRSRRTNKNKEKQRKTNNNSRANEAHQQANKQIDARKGRRQGWADRTKSTLQQSQRQVTFGRRRSCVQTKWTKFIWSCCQYSYNKVR